MQPASSSSSSPGGAAAADRPRKPSKKQRILWDSDSATRDGKTSISILLEWLSAPGNYDRWTEGKSQFGETRETLCTEINSIMKQHGILHRANANIRTHIGELERSYDTAVAWLHEQGYEGRLPASTSVGIENESDGNSEIGAERPVDPVEAYVLRICRYFLILDLIIAKPSASRARMRRLSSGSKKRALPEDDERSDLNDDQAAKIAGTPVNSLANSPTDSEGPAPSVSPATSLPELIAKATRPAKQPFTSSSEPSLKRKVSSSSTSQEAAVTTGTGAAAASIPTMNPSAAMSPFALFAPFFASHANVGAPSSTAVQTTNATVVPAVPGQAAVTPPESWQATASTFANYENTQRMILQATKEERDRKRFQLEEERHALECTKLRYEIEAQKTELAVQRALGRKKLLDAGIPMHEVNRMVPEPTQEP